MSSEIYTPSFFDLTTPGSLKGAKEVLPLLWQYRKFDSVVDVGCGVAAWLLVAKELGAATVCGVDGPQVPPDKFMIDPALIERRDLEQPLSLDRKYDLCLCLEVAEHLSPHRAESFVGDLTRLSDIVAFSAAIPFQGGDGHVNEMWPEYWAQIFAKQNYLVWASVRNLIWHNREIPWWYRQNLMLYVNKSIWHAFLNDQHPSDIFALTLIHPESYLWNVRRKTLELRTSYEFDLDAFYSCAAGKRREAPGYGPEFPAPRPSEAS